MLNKKKMIKTVAMLLASMLSFSTLSFAGCSKNNSSKVEEPEKIVRGLHEKSVSQTNVVLANNKDTEYVIVIGENEENDAVLFAIDELRQNFFKATGATLEVKRDNEISYDENARILSVGENALVAQAGVTYNKDELGPSGYVVQTKGKSVFMVGPTANGSLYAVYGWLNAQFDYEYYSIGEVYIEESLGEEKLLNVTLKEKPDFDYRMTNHGEAWFDKTVARRAKFDAPDSIWVEFDHAQYHTSFNIVPPELYLNEDLIDENDPENDDYHPEWYAQSGEQLCFSRDPDGLLEVVVERMKKEFTEQPDKNLATFTQQDHNSWCECTLCMESYAKYGTHSAVYIQFVNRVAEEVSKWAEEAFPGREIMIAMFAYQKTEDAPVKETVNGYEPIDDTVRLHKNVALFYAPIYASYYYDFNNEANVKAATTMDKWNVLSDNLFAWIYGANFRIYLAPHSNFHSMQENYRFLYDRGTKYIFDQQQFNQVAGTDWYKLKMYLSSKMQWQIDCDQNELIDNFFDNYYKEASEPMRRLFDEEQTWIAYLAQEKKYDGRVSYTYAMLLKEDWWPRGVLEGWLEIIDEAYKAIEPLKKTNPSLYETLKQRITLESITFRFMQLEMYSVNYYESEVKEMTESLKFDCIALGVRQYNEQSSLEGYWD